jgi:hypothetical protein
MRPYRLALAVVAVTWLALVLLSPAPVNPAVDGRLRLEAHSAVPAQVKGVLARACFDCHSDETRWPWYARLPPVSWLVAHDVAEGRGQMNFSRWDDYNAFDQADMLDKMCDLTTKKKMPLWQYRLGHADARLAEADVSVLCAWTRQESARLVQGGGE